WLPSTVLCSVDRPAFRLAEAVALGDGVSAPRAGAVLGAERRCLGALASVCRLPGQRHVHRWRRKRALSPLVKAKPEIVAMGGAAVSALRCGVGIALRCRHCAASWLFAMIALVFARFCGSADGAAGAMFIGGDENALCRRW